MKEENIKLNEDIKHRPEDGGVKKLEEENNKLKDEINKLSEELNKIKNTEDKDFEPNIILEENIKLKDENNKKDEELSNLKMQKKAELKALKNKIDEVNKNMDKLKEENEKLKQSKTNPPVEQEQNVFKEAFQKLNDENNKLMEEYNTIKLELKKLQKKNSLSSNSSNIESDRMKEENDNLKKELNEYKEKTKSLEEEKKKMNDDISKLKEEKEHIQTTSDILNKIKLINTEIKPGEEANQITIPSGTNTKVNKTVQDMGDGRIVETIEIVTEEEVVSDKDKDKDKSNSNSSISKEVVISPETQKIVQISEEKPSPNTKIITTTTTTTTTTQEAKPDSDFLKKVKMFSPKVEEKVISTVGGPKKVTIKESSISADKTKSKEDRMNKAMARIKKKRDKDSEDKEKTPAHNPNDPMFKSARIKNMAALLEQHMNEGDNTSKPGGPSGIAGGVGIGHQVITKEPQNPEDAFEHMADILQSQPGKILIKRKMSKKMFEDK